MIIKLDFLTTRVPLENDMFNFQIEKHYIALIELLNLMELH